jgi:hypothetical protein
MVKMEQLLLFEEPLDEKNEREIQLLKKQAESARKAQFGQISKLLKEQQEMKHELETLKAAICKGESMGWFKLV